MKLKESIPEVTEAVQQLMALAGKFVRGQVIGWLEIEAIAGDRTENRPRHIINKWRRQLEKELEIVTLVADSVGVRLLTHLETAREIPRLRQRKAYRQVRRGIKQTQTVDPTQLRDHDRRLLLSQQENMAATRRDLFRSQQELKAAFKPTETMPRRRSAVETK